MSSLIVATRRAGDDEAGAGADSGAGWVEHAASVAPTTKRIAGVRTRLAGAEEGRASDQHLSPPPERERCSAPSPGAPVPDEPMKNLRPSGNVTSRPFARFRVWSLAW